MALKEILSVVAGFQDLEVYCFDVDGSRLAWRFKANNVPLGMWERTVENLASVNDVLYVRINN